MLNIDSKPKLKVYRGNNMDLWLTYRPVLRRNLAKLGKDVDYLFTTNQWPPRSSNE